MYVPASTKQENATQLASKEHAQKEQGDFVVSGMADNRPEALQLKALKTLSENSAQAGKTAQLQQLADNHTKQQPIQKQENNTGLPDNLKSGVENLSGYSLNDVNVHYNSSKPAQLEAHAYAQGTDIHVAPGQEKHLPHEAWHVVQQKQGRVKPTRQLKGTTNINDDSGLEKEADVMGAKALNASIDESADFKDETSSGNETTQLKTTIKHTTGTVNANGGNHTVGLVMNAQLDPEDPVKGSATGVNSDWMRWIRGRYPAANVVRGHLLNHDLGGFGIEENLYPISTKANADHSSKVEQNVKGELSDLDSLVSAKDQGYIYYNVTVKENDTYKDAEFRCDWGVKAPGVALKAIGAEIIPSKLETDKGGFGGGRRGKQSPASWRHGTSKGGTEVTAVRERLGSAMKDGRIAFTAKPTDHQGSNVAKADKQDAIELLNDLVDEIGAQEALNQLKKFYETCDDKYNAIVYKLIKLLEAEFTWD